MLVTFDESSIAFIASHVIACRKDDKIRSWFSTFCSFATSLFIFFKQEFSINHEYWLLPPKLKHSQAMKTALCTNVATVIYHAALSDTETKGERRPAHMRKDNTTIPNC